jgi:hypothetical protein
VVEGTYAISAGKSKVKATITIAIDGNIIEQTDVSSGGMASHTVPLAKDWTGCDEFSFSMVQKGLGTPITFNESHALIPICTKKSLEIGDDY